MKVHRVPEMQRRSRPRCAEALASGRRDSLACAAGSGWRRSGFVAVIALIGLLLTGMIGTSLVRLAITRHRQLQGQTLHVQAEWLAESGLERAAARLAADAGYSGETWDLTADSLGGRHAGRVVITIQRGDNDEGRVQVTAVADYPLDAAERARSRRAVRLEPQRGPMR